MAKITQMATTASTEVVSLQQDRRERETEREGGGERERENEREKEEQKQENKVRLCGASPNPRICFQKLPESAFLA